MAWRRWKWDDVKEDAIEIHPDDLPNAPFTPPTIPCSLCWRNWDLVPDWDSLPRVIRRASRVIHVRKKVLPNAKKKRLRTTRCGRYYIVERDQK